MPPAEDDKAPIDSAVLPESPGALLRAARIAQGLSLDDVVHELHLDRPVIEALEADNFAVLGAPVFVRGHLRGYARMLGIPSEPLLEACRQAEPDTTHVRALAVSPVAAPRFRFGAVVVIICLLLLAAGGWFYLLGQSGDDKPAGAELPVEPVALAPVPDADRAAISSEPEPESTAIDMAAIPDTVPPAMATPVTDSAVPEVSSPVPSERAAVARVRLELEFMQECWVELADAQRRLLYGLERPGITRRFEVELPARLFLGNADAVAIRLNEREYRLPQASRTGNNTARLTLTAADIQGPIR